MVSRVARICSYFLIIYVLYACSSEKITASSRFANTQWMYKDSELSYLIIFHPGGEIISEHPDDVTAYNDFWYEQKGRLYFHYNNRYSKFKSTSTSDSLVTGKATNKKLKCWNWSMTPVPSDTLIEDTH